MKNSNHVPRRRFLQGAATLSASALFPWSPRAAAAEATAAAGTTFVSGREDDRFVQTAGFLHKQLQALQPRLEFRPGMTRDEFTTWRGKVREKLLDLLAFPEVPAQPEPKRVWSRPRAGYRLERWESFPEPHCAVPFYFFIPAGVSQQSPAPAVLCFPGSADSKELLAGEPALG